MKSAIEFSLLITLLFFAFSCESTEPDEINPEEKIALEIIGTMPEQVELKFTSTTINLTDSISIYRSDLLPIPLATFLNDVAETTFIDNNKGLGLEWNISYSYYAKIKGETNKATKEITTFTGEPDTTTRNFSIEVFEFPSVTPESNYLEDVWVFDESNIWAVGAINSFENETMTFNILHWNGFVWKRKGGLFNTSGIEDIWALDSNLVYLITGGIVKYEDGNFNVIDLIDLGFDENHSFRAAWGASKDNVFAVGTSGAIVHYNGESWSRINFRDDVHFRGICGNNQTGIAYAYGIYMGLAGRNTVVTEITSSGVSEIYDDGGYYNYTNSIFSLNDKVFCTSLKISSDDIYTIDQQTRQRDIIHHVKEDFVIKSAVAISDKDIFYIGHNSESGKLYHYNGQGYDFLDFPIQSPAVNGTHGVRNLIVNVGYINSSAYIIIIRREISAKWK